MTNEEALITELTDLEWSVRIELPGELYVPSCPRCRQTRDYGHAADCSLAALIGAPTVVEPQVIWSEEETSVT